MPLSHQSYNSLGRRFRLAGWLDAKFGLFIRWGPVSVEGTESGWSRAGERRGFGSKGIEVPTERYDNRLTVKTEIESNPSFTLDHGEVQEVTAFSAANLDVSAQGSNNELHLELSAGGSTWTEGYRSSYGLAQWEIPLKRFVAGIQQPGIPTRYARYSNHVPIPYASPLHQ
jgi:hypothetical protein